MKTYLVLRPTTTVCSGLLLDYCDTLSSLINLINTWCDFLACVATGRHSPRSSATIYHLSIRPFHRVPHVVGWVAVVRECGSPYCLFMAGHSNKFLGINVRHIHIWFSFRLSSTRKYISAYIAIIIEFIGVTCENLLITIEPLIATSCLHTWDVILYSFSLSKNIDVRYHWHDCISRQFKFFVFCFKIF